ncbi:MAG: flavin prenyltransferase UbiX [Thermodesulfobacteriota bacterium]|nr:flavin prenyltransferase UbiX [Thermodesulfobacteriota bacterium]
MSSSRHIAVALTGASGAIYGITLIQQLLNDGHRVSLLISSAGRQVMALEQGLKWSEDIAVFQQQARIFFTDENQRLFCYGEQDFTAPLASGSSAADAMVIVPASMGTVARVATGISGNLIERVADVMLKERRPLIIVPRESPFNTIHLQNLLTLSQIGAIILPAMPAFYSQPQTMEELINFVVGKIFDSLGFPHSLFVRWGENQ